MPALLQGRALFDAAGANDGCLDRGGLGQGGFCESSVQAGANRGLKGGFATFGSEVADPTPLAFANDWSSTCIGPWFRVAEPAL